MHYYSLYDLPICSELPLTDIPLQAREQNKKYLDIRLGSVSPEGIPQPTRLAWGFQSNHREFWLNIPSVARFLINNGEEIIIDPYEGIDEASLRAFLLSTVMEMLLQQRGLFSCPGFVIRPGNGGIAFTGTPGTGYAMIQGGFFKKGYSFGSTQRIVLNAKAEMLPGMATLELWPEVASALRFNPDTFKTVRPAIEKSVIPLGNQFYSKKLPLKAIFILKQYPGSEIHGVSLKNEEKIPCLQEAARHHPASLFLPAEYCRIIEDLEVVLLQLPVRGMPLQGVMDALENQMLTWAGMHVEC